MRDKALWRMWLIKDEVEMCHGYMEHLDMKEINLKLWNLFIRLNNLRTRVWSFWYNVTEDSGPLTSQITLQYVSLSWWLATVSLPAVPWIDMDAFKYWLSNVLIRLAFYGDITFYLLPQYWARVLHLWSLLNFLCH